MSRIIQPWQGLITGWAGNMGSDKTTRLIAKALDSRKHRSGIAAYQPLKAVRDQDRPDEIRARNGLILPGVVAYCQPSEILTDLDRRRVKNIFLDEVQFNDQTPELRTDFQRVIRTLAAAEYSIFWAGLPRDFLGETFETVGWLMGITDQLQALQAECDNCGRIPAPFPQRLRNGQPVSQSDPRFITDSDENQAQGVTYEARCVLCYKIAE